MEPRRVASIAAVLGGLVWLVKVGLIWANGGENTGSGLVAVAFFGGLALLVVALAASGYTLVETAPVWLRAIVTVCTPLLVMMVWQLLDQAIKAVYTAEGWLRGELNIILAAVVALLLGLWEIRRVPPSANHADPPSHARQGRGRRAAR